MNSEAQVGDTRELLAHFTELLNKHGVDSLEATQYLESNKHNDEFVELAETARWLKGALTAPPPDTSGTATTPLTRGG